MVAKTVIVARATGRVALWSWHLLVRNRLAIAIASLAWLIFRSGTQPRRLAYPCQQAAAINVGAVAAGLIPTLFLARRHCCPHAVPRHVVIRCQLLIAGLMFAVAFGGIEVYQFAESAIPPQLPEAPSGPLGDPTPTYVGIAQVPSPDEVLLTQAEIEGLVREAVGYSGGLAGIVHNNDVVVIKPNLVQRGASPGYGVCTNKYVTAAVIEMVKEAASNVTVKIAEGAAWSDGGNDGRVTDDVYQDYGYDASPKDGWFDLDTTVQCIDLNDTGGWGSTSGATWVPISGVLRSGYWVPNTLINCNVLISVPTFKNHSNGTITLGIKNRMGCSPGDIYYDRDDGSKQPLHRGLHFTNYWSWTVPPAPANEDETVRRTVVDLNLVRPNDFVVIDATVGITNGPGGGNTAHPHTQMIIAGRDSVAVDTVGALCMCYDPEYIVQLTYANTRLGTKDRKYITVLGDHVMTVRSDDFPGGYNGSVIVEKIPPWIGDISLTEGQRVSGTVTISGSGIGDNVGVIKAELAIDGEYVETDRASPYSFSWDSTTVADGWHAVKFTVYDAALNEASITRNVEVYNLLVPGDFNLDRDVDDEDRLHLTGCMAGPGVPVTGLCADTSLDGDTDADQTDFGILQRCLTGPDVDGDPECAD